MASRALLGFFSCVVLPGAAMVGCSGTAPAPGDRPPDARSPNARSPHAGSGAAAAADAPIAEGSAAKLPTENATGTTAPLAGCEGEVFSLDECGSLISIAAPDARRACDSGFSPPKVAHIDCETDDLVCHIRTPGWRDTVIYYPPPPEEAADCLRECAEGQGASCHRISRAFTMRSADDAEMAIRQVCRASFLRRACQLGVPPACDAAQTRCGEGDDLDPKAAFARLESACDPVEASWECFYAAHNVEMMWGTPLRASADTTGLYERVCGAKCPPSPERCFRGPACERVAARRRAPRR